MVLAVILFPFPIRKLLKPSAISLSVPRIALAPPPLKSGLRILFSFPAIKLFPASNVFLYPIAIALLPTLDVVVPIMFSSPKAILRDLLVIFFLPTVNELSPPISFSSPTLAILCAFITLSFPTESIVFFPVTEPVFASFPSPIKRILLPPLEILVSAPIVTNVLKSAPPLTTKSSK